MDLNLEDKRKIKINTAYDVIVVGGGISGISASVASARKGAKTLLIEKTALFGGLATLGLITWYEPICDCHGKQMIAGIPEELLKLSVKYGFDTLADSWEDKTTKIGSTECYASYYSPSLFALAIDGYLKENNVNIRLDTLSTYPVMEGNTCTGIITESVSGKEFFPCSYVIDATGDASIFYRAGAPCVDGENFLTAVAQGFYKQDIEKCSEKNYDAFHLSKWFVSGSDLYGHGHQGKLFHGTDAEEETEFLLKTREMIFDKIKNDDKNTRDVSRLPFMPTFRTIRHIVGEYEFSSKDENVIFKDSVGSFGDFRQKGPDNKPRHYHLPYSSLYNKNFGNIIACGRIISCDREGWELTRVIPVASLSGQASGTAAALCVKTKSSFDKLDYSLLRKTLEKDNVLFEK